MTQMTTRRATALMFERYATILDGMVDAKTPTDPAAGFDNLRWMCRTALTEIDAYPLDKLSRWLGFIQGVLVVTGVVTTDGERDFSRPLFHAAYAAEGKDIPPTRNRGDDQ